MLATRVAYYTQQLVVIFAVPVLAIPYFDAIKEQARTVLWDKPEGVAVALIIVTLILAMLFVVTLLHYTKIVLLLQGVIFSVLVIFASRILIIESQSMAADPPHYAVMLEDVNVVWSGNYSCPEATYHVTVNDSGSELQLFCGAMFCCNQLGLNQDGEGIDNRCPLYFTEIHWIAWVLLFTPRFIHWLCTVMCQCQCCRSCYYDKAQEEKYLQVDGQLQEQERHEQVCQS